jgi:hypothetical protein
MQNKTAKQVLLLKQERFLRGNVAYAVVNFLIMTLKCMFTKIRRNNTKKTCCYLSGDDFRFIKINQGFLSICRGEELCGFVKDFRKNFPCLFRNC